MSCDLLITPRVLALLFPNLAATFFFLSPPPISDGGAVPVPDSQQIRQSIATHLPHVFDHSINDTGVMSYVIEHPETMKKRSKDHISNTPPFVSSLIGSMNWGESSRVVCVAHVNPLEVVASPAHIMVSTPPPSTHTCHFFTYILARLAPRVATLN